MSAAIKMIFRAMSAAAAVFVVGTIHPASFPASVDFNRDIRPILSGNCLACHGPDEKARKARLRLDRKEDAFKPLKSDGYAIVPGNPARSKLIERITARDEEERMPPARTGKKLTKSQIEMMRRWIAQGARYPDHWAFVKPETPLLPKVKMESWPRNGIDYFVLARLEKEHLKPSPEADKAALIRRVSLDLTGLPPTPDQADAFLSDKSAAAYENVVDRLLASPRYGERMAIRWLDAARYADTSGYQSDGERYMWRWRDWVIDAFNHNQPFDQFTIEQIAGDLLPNATLDQLIATGFNRNHRGNAEGGIIPEEYAVEYVVDRVDTTFTVWLGLTMGCARCHDHKYDPITQKEFYQVFAFFNNVPEKGRAIKIGNSPPLITAPTPPQQMQMASFERKVTEAEANLRKQEPALAAAQAEWETRITNCELRIANHEPRTTNREPRSTFQNTWSISQGLVAHFDLDGNTTNHSDRAKPARFTNGEPAFAPGRIGRAGDLDGERFIDAGNVGDFGFFDEFSFSAWMYPRGDRGGAVLSRMTEAPEAEGYSLRLESGKVQANFVKRWLDDALRVETEAGLAPNRWHHVMLTYDGSRVATGVKIYVNGKAEKIKVTLDELNQSFKTSEPFRIGSGGGPESRFHGLIDDVRVYHRVLSPEEVEVVSTADSISDIAALPASQRSSPQAQKLRAYFLEHDAPEPIRQARERFLGLRQQRDTLIGRLPTTMVMEEMKTPRDTFILRRGEYDKKGEQVTANVPASLFPLPLGAEKNRLGFAKWLVHPSNPLTARVAVNHYWQMYFGSGLVKTAEDFGARGEMPSHPELLDWLATEFVRTGWDIKAVQKLIVMSATYRQSSKVTPELLQKDPENRWLARGPRIRLSAEMVRDQALAASGLLVENVGGPSVMPYQPKGLWNELSGADYPQDKGEKLYRRSLYTFWKRTSPPPSMMTFDAAGRETCSVRHTRTSTPLQALTLMNDVTFVEASRLLAQRMMSEGGDRPADRITYAFRLATARQPRPAELNILLAGFSDHLSHYRQNEKAALELSSAGQFPRNEKLDVFELAAYTAVANLILNLDETITKQ